MAPQIAALQVPGKITIVSFTDFECPFCRKLHPILHGIIDKQLAYRLEQLASLRNLLAYDREQTDIDEVYTQVQTRVPDLLAFADQIERFIGADTPA